MMFMRVNFWWLLKGLKRQIEAAILMLVMGNSNASVGDNIYNWKTHLAFLKADAERKKLFTNYISYMNQD
jgi:hypothetical protein